MNATTILANYLQTHQPIIGKVVDFDTTDKLFTFDFTAANQEIGADVIADTQKFTQWIAKKLADNNCRYGIGGYMEHRTLYARSTHFDTDGEPRRLHLGIDIWAEAGTPVYTPLPATIHSFNDNDHFGDYGPTIILTHRLNGFQLYSLYGHLSRKSLEGLRVGQEINTNQRIGNLGDMHENGHWPPHLHYQLMLDLEGCAGDYPGVGRYSEKEKWLKNIPDPDLLLRFPK
ncbi:MAG TPA: peptidoglycan DD-metalloendopeptidase family protein [Mucilaginibacter sp.]